MPDNYLQEIADKTHEYNEYIREHRNNVIKAWTEMQEKCKDEKFVYDEFWFWQIDAAVKSHDMSKYSAEEFTQYRNSFYPCDGEDVDKKSFDNAWKHHYETNIHHWEHWYSDGKFNICDDEAPLMSTNYCMIYIGYVEMICDMTAMGYKFGDNALTYYEKNKEEIKILPEWIDFVESILKKMAA